MGMTNHNCRERNAGAVANRGSIVYGLHAAESVLQRRSHDIHRAYFVDGAASTRVLALRSAIKSLAIELNAVSRSELDRICDGGTHQGVALEVRALAMLGVTDLESLVSSLGRSVRLLVLDQVEDPRNLGACLRTADAAGVHAVVVTKAHSAKLTPAALKAATGAAETVPVVIVPNLARALAWLKVAGVWVVGADASAGRALHDTELKPPIAIVLGAEGRGMRRLTRESCDELVEIPMHGSVESLNVSVAAGVVLFELARQAPPRRLEL
jgi:23S rRNA (guanosine2251-2'-O)-methyltransferase